MFAEKVQKRIQKVKEENLTELDLTGSYFSEKLAEIPAEVFQLTELEVLKLNRNKITKIPQAIGKLSKLKELHLFGNSLSLNQIDILLSLLPSLTYLGVRWHKSYWQSLNLFTHLQQLGIDLSDNQLTEVAESLSQLVNLTQSLAQWCHFKNKR